jgi:isoleucyl-tRNA synthetase
MSKSKKNTVDPNTILNAYGADALRWYLMTVSPPWVPTRFDEDGVLEVLRKFLGTLVNVYSFFAMYTNIDRFVYERPKMAVARRSEIDRWLLSSRNRLVGEVEGYLQRYDVTKATRRIGEFVVDDLSNWYVRRSRRRFWKAELGDDKLAAYETLYEVLITIVKLTAPFVPFISEELFLNLTRPQTEKPKSVHLASYPKASDRGHAFRDQALEGRMATLRRVVNLGRLLRNESGVKVRQPLARLLIVAKDDTVRQQIEVMRDLVVEELNVKSIEFVREASELVRKRAVPQFKTLGPRLGKQAGAVGMAIREFEHHQVTVLETEGKIAIGVNGNKVTIELQDVIISSESAEGLVVQQEGDLVVALDITITESLKMEGLAREFVNRVQNMRKNAGYEVVDRINIYAKLPDILQQAVSLQSDYICNETLAQIISNELIITDAVQEWKIDGENATIAIERI